MATGQCFLLHRQREGEELRHRAAEQVPPELAVQRRGRPRRSRALPSMQPRQRRLPPNQARPVGDPGGRLSAAPRATAARPPCQCPCSLDWLGGFC
jgi:hypothetical protein